MQITWPTKADSRVLCRCEEDAYYSKIMIVNDIHVEISWMGKKQGWKSWKCTAKSSTPVRLEGFPGKCKSLKNLFQSEGFMPSQS